MFVDDDCWLNVIKYLIENYYFFEKEDSSFVERWNLIGEFNWWMCEWNEMYWELIVFKLMMLSVLFLILVLLNIVLFFSMRTLILA